MIREGRTQDGTWLPTDRALAVALTLYEQSFGACGHPMGKAYGGTGGWDVETIVCAACAAEEQYRKDNPDPEPGLKVYAVEADSAADSPGEVKPVFGPPPGP